MVCIELSCFIRAPALAAAAFAAADEPGQQMARRFAVLAGAYIFVALLAVAIVNQLATLSAISEEIERQRGRIANEFAAVSSQFEDVIVWTRASGGIAPR